MISTHERDYIIWQNRAVDFYVAARLLVRRGLWRPASYCAVTSVELLLKATLVYFDRSFVPEDSNHNIRKMLRILENKGPKGKSISIPNYFFFENRYQSVSRYPTNGKGLTIPTSFLIDLDKTFAVLLVLVPFQFNSELIRILSGRDKYKHKLTLLRYANSEMKVLRKHLQRWIRHK